ncbi:helix-turn-helix domain-containing protein [Streptomyces sp. TLI_105]|uniref:helix-turn-helix domain-containing protein n=1 Tax=Streptomyces sp. TLI_105 TaxID=1881019 RepID=UPI002109DE82|nr:helix-turn-helix domain-containing protein [Streptomyces sp. TLI_105]
MPLSTACPTAPSAAERALLKAMAYGRKTEHRLRVRAQVVLHAARGRSKARVAQETGLHLDTVRRWRGRFAEQGLPGLKGRQRCGRPPVFTPLQVAEVKAPACRLAAESGVLLSRWSCPELAYEATRRGIAAFVSAPPRAPLAGRRRAQALAAPLLDLHHRPRLTTSPTSLRSGTGSEPSKTATTPQHSRSSGSSPPPTWTIYRPGSTGTPPITRKNPLSDGQRDQPPKDLLTRPLLIFSLVPWERRPRRWDPEAVSFKPSSVVPPLTRPQLAEARRVRAAELFGQGRSGAEIARMLGVSEESARRWKRVWEEGGADALRRRPATGRPPKLDDAQGEAIRAALEQGARAHGFEADLWTLERVGLVVERATGVALSRASVWRLLTGRLGWSLQRPERRAVERDESEIARWIAHEWPRIKKGR